MKSVTRSDSALLVLAQARLTVQKKQQKKNKTKNEICSIFRLGIHRWYQFVL